ncbi:type VI immunity family protein [Pseudoduganella sp. S-14]|uniref:type VI immunity family protein n=1 Tax=Pseudoduganella sp. S-14 TaxID=3404065 RepID=UPI003CF8B4BF
MSELPFDPIQLMREHPEKLEFPGGLLTKKGAQSYVGSVPAIAGTLFFADAHLPAVREAICECFDEFKDIAGKHLTWLFREDPPEGRSASKLAYESVKPMRTMMAALEQDDAVSFHYTSGKQVNDTGPWEFQAFGLQEWCAKAGDRGLSGLRFSFPLLFVEDNPTAFQAMFVSFAKRVRAIHGYGGYSLNLSAIKYDDNQAFETVIASKMLGFDAGILVSGAVKAHTGIKTVSWLTAVNYQLLEKVGGMNKLRSELPMDWFATYDYGDGVVIQSGPKPEAAPVDETGVKPALLVLPNMLFKPIRAPQYRLHFASAGSEFRLIGLAAEEWLQRLDIDESGLLDYKAKLLKEPKLTKESVLSPPQVR